MADWWLAIPQLGAALAMLVLAGFLLWAKLGNTANRAFAAYLVLLGAATASLAMTQLLSDAGAETQSDLWGRVRGHVQLALAPALAFFLVAYLWPGRAWSRWTRAGIALATLAAEAFVLAEPCAMTCDRPDGLHNGPLLLLPLAGVPMAAIVGLVLVLQARRHAETARGKASRLVGLALALTALFDACLAIATLLLQPVPVTDAVASVWTSMVQPTRAIGALPALAALLVDGWTTGTRTRRSPWPLAGLAAAALAAAAYLGSKPEVFVVGLVLIGVIRTALVGAVVLALVRHRLFGAEARVRATLRHGTLAGCFVAVFFVIEQLVQTLANAALGALAGALATGVLLFFLAPVGRFAERVAGAAVPRVAKSDRMGIRDRRALFRDQAELVWSDGRLDARDRLLLDHLRARLGLTAEVATRLEQEVAGEAFAARRGRAPPRKPKAARNPKQAP